MQLTVLHGITIMIHNITAHSTTCSGVTFTSVFSKLVQSDEHTMCTLSTHVTRTQGTQAQYKLCK